MTTIVNNDIKIDTNFYKVLGLDFLTDEAFIINLPKNRFQFKAGQHITLAIKGDYQSREYSIYSGIGNDNLQVLVKEVEGGYFSPKLKHLKPGDWVEVHGPFGRFGLDDSRKDTHHHVFIASGTGIAPFHSIVNSYENLDYQIIHGVRFMDEGYESGSYDPARFVLCTSRDLHGNFHGRVTEYLKKSDFTSNTVFYLCGNSNMIFDSMEILKNKGFDRNDIKVEVYF
jgi:ferredoxin-NADP reductase